MSDGGDFIKFFIWILVCVGLVYGLIYHPLVKYPKEMNIICKEQFNYDGFTGGVGANKECFRDLNNGTLEVTEIKYFGDKWYLDGSSYYRSDLK